MNKKVSLHMIVGGEFIQNIARQRFWFEDAETAARNLLKYSLDGITDEQVAKIINGDAQLTGNSICDDTNCEQCVNYRKDGPIKFIEKPDNKFKKEITNRLLWFNEGHYKVGEFHIPKRKVYDYITMLARCYKGHTDPNESDEVQIARRSFWAAGGYRYPSPKYMPREGSQDYIFAETIDDFLDEIQDHVQEMYDKYMSPYHVADDLEKILLVKYAEIKQTETPFKPKDYLHTGYIQVKVPDPKLDYEYRTIILDKAHLLNYLHSREIGTRALKFTKSLETRLGKDGVLDRYKNIQKNMGDAHAKLMESVHLEHSDSGVYSPSTCEYYFNEIVQWFVLDNLWISEEHPISKLPDQITLELPDNHGYGILYVDGKLVREYLEFR